MSCIVQVVLRNAEEVNRWYQRQRQDAWQSELVERIECVCSEACEEAKLHPSLIEDREIQPLSEADLMRFQLERLEHANRLACSLLAAPSLVAEQSLELGIGIGVGQALSAATQAKRLASLSRPGEVVIPAAAYGELPYATRDRFGPEEKEDGGIRRGFAPTLPRCFVISPFGDPGSETRKHADHVFEHYVKPACAEQRFRPVRSDKELSQAIRGDLESALAKDPMVIAYMGSSPWSPNVMLEIGYRLATRKSIVFLSSSREDSHEPKASRDLPFDLGDRQIIELPAIGTTDREPIDTARSRLAKAIENVPPGPTWESDHPYANIEFDPERANLIHSGTPQAARLFARPKGLADDDVNEVIAALGKLMPDEQARAFSQEQKALIDHLGSSATNGDREEKIGAVTASVPIVFEEHPDGDFNERAFLPIIVRHRRAKGTLSVDVLYLDVTSATHVDAEGRFVCTLTDPESTTGLVWDRYATSYDHILPELSFYCDVRDGHVKAMSDRQNVLEIGAGTGNVVILLLEKRIRVVAVDANRAMLDVLRAKVERRDDKEDRILILEHTAESLPGLHAGRFDGVSIMLALFAMKEPWNALDEAIRLLAPGGHIVITEPKESFQLQPLIERGARELQDRGKFQKLRKHWNRVMQVNKRINPERNKPLFRAERVAHILKNRGFQEIRMNDAYIGHCTTIEATKSS